MDRRPPRALRRRRADERGAVVPIVAILIGLLVTVTAFTVDLGQQRVARTDMQSLSDLVALDTSRLLGGQTTASVLTDSAFKSSVMASVNRNAKTFGATPKVKVEVGTYDGTNFTTSGSLTYTAGGQAVGNVVITSAEDVPSAAKVTSGTTVGFAFVPGSGAANRSAIAVTDSSACYEVGSYAAAVNSNNSALLGPLLGTLNSNLNLTAAGYQGLANTAIKLSDLAVALGVGSVDQLATASVTYRNFYAALAQVLTQNGQTANVSLLNTLSASASATAQVAISNIIALGVGSNAAIKATANLLDLVSASAFLANGQNLINLPLSASIPGLASVSTKVKLIQNISKYCGRVGTQETTATPAGTSQVEVTLGATVSGTTVTIPLVGTVSVGSPANQPVSLLVQGAPTYASLTSVGCQTPTNSVQSATFDMTNGLLTETLTVPLSVSGTVSLLGIGLVNVAITTNIVVTTTISPTATTYTITVPPQSFDTVYSTGTTSLTLGNTVAKTGTVVTAKILGIPITLSTAAIDSILDPVVSSVVQPIISGLNSALISPLLNLLGIRVGGADMILDSNPALSCSVPALRK